jgi:glutamate dehydrogenase (NAD(P)+)
MMTRDSEFDSDLYRTALGQLDRVAEWLNLDADVHERLRYPRRALVVSVPARMIVYALLEAARRLGQELKGSRVVVQGVGNVGSVVARLQWREGCHIVGVADVNGGIWNPRGLDVRQLAARVSESGSIVGVPDADAVSNADILEQPCDVLVPAAVGSQLRQANAERVKAPIVAEGAHDARGGCDPA